MTEAFKRYLSKLDDELPSFEALCFHRSEVVAKPYSALLNSPKRGHGDVAPAIAETAYEISAPALRQTSADLSGAEIFAYAVGGLLEGPGCIPGLISTRGPHDSYDWFECSIGRERGGALDSTFTLSHSCGLTLDTFFFFNDPLWEGASVSFSTDHLTNLGVEFAIWLFGERIESLRLREQRDDSLPFND